VLCILLLSFISHHNCFLIEESVFSYNGERKCEFGEKASCLSSFTGLAYFAFVLLFSLKPSLYCGWVALFGVFPLPPSHFFLFSALIFNIHKQH
jgi:hypothetical protein